MYRAIVFDVDGVLLSLHPGGPAVYREGVATAFREFGVEASPADLDAFVGSGVTIEGMVRVCDRHGVDFEDFWPRREAQVSALQARMMERGERTLYDDCALIPDLADARDLGIVSNNQHATVEHLLDHFDLGSHFETCYGRDPTVEGFRRTKPDTHYLDRALADLGTRSVLYVGDSNCDVLVAEEAGVDSAFLWRSHREGYELAVEPTYEIESLMELVEIVEG